MDTLLFCSLSRNHYTLKHHALQIPVSASCQLGLQVTWTVKELIFQMLQHRTFAVLCQSTGQVHAPFDPCQCCKGIHLGSVSSRHKTCSCRPDGDAAPSESAQSPQQKAAQHPEAKSTAGRQQGAQPEEDDELTMPLSEPTTDWQVSRKGMICRSTDD